MKPVAYRLWRMHKGRLVSLSERFVWKRGTNISRPETIPTFGEAHPRRTCQCGFYGYWSPNRDLLLSASGPAVEGPRVAGAIACSGKAVIHAQGLRASRAKVVGLCDIDGCLDTAQAREITQHYQVPMVEDLACLQVIAAEHGRAVREEELSSDPGEVCPTCGWDHIALEVGLRLNVVPEAHVDQALRQHGISPQWRPWGSSIATLVEKGGHNFWRAA